MSSTPKERTDSKKRKWAAFAAKGKTRWVVSRGVVGFGITMTAFTFVWEHLRDYATLTFRQISLDLLVRVPVCLVTGYLFGLLTWKWFSLRYGRTDHSER